MRLSTNVQQPGASVLVVIVNYRTPALTLAAAQSAMAASSDPGLRIIVVDGGSDDGSAEALGDQSTAGAFDRRVTVLPLPINGGFGWANNQAILAAMQSDRPPDYVYLLNPDAQIDADAFDALIDALERHPRCAAVGSLLIDEDGTPSGSAFRFPSPGRELVRGARTGSLGRLLGIASTVVLEADACEVDWVTGASVMFRTEALRQVGLFDTGFFLYFEEVELMWRLRAAGWSVRHEPKSRVRHIGGAATGMVYNRKDLKIGPPLPRYWFMSRRRLFALTRGRTGTTLAGLLWLAGHGFYVLRRALGRGADQIPNRSEASDLLAYGIVASAGDTKPHSTAWNDAPGEPPAWMGR